MLPKVCWLVLGKSEADVRPAVSDAVRTSLGPKGMDKMVSPDVVRIIDQS
jgi:chaperonin GroEL (HSP60 family)